LRASSASSTRPKRSAGSSKRGACSPSRRIGWSRVRRPRDRERFAAGRRSLDDWMRSRMHEIDTRGAAPRPTPGKPGRWGALPRLRVDWFDRWHPDLDAALATLPEMPMCPHELYRDLVTNRGPVEKRAALV